MKLKLFIELLIVIVSGSLCVKFKKDLKKAEQETKESEKEMLKAKENLNKSNDD